jgi:hypothetical protein
MPVPKGDHVLERSLDAGLLSYFSYHPVVNVFTCVEEACGDFPDIAT